MISTFLDKINNNTFKIIKSMHNIGKKNGT